jgi:transposase
MAKPYSDDLRLRIAAALAGGESCRSIAERFNVAPSTVVKWSKRIRETGSPTPAKFGGHKTSSLVPHRAFVLAQIEEVPHLTLHRLKDLLAERGGRGLARYRLALPQTRGLLVQKKRSSHLSNCVPMS